MSFLKNGSTEKIEKLIYILGEYAVTVSDFQENKIKGR